MHHTVVGDKFYQPHCDRCVEPTGELPVMPKREMHVPIVLRTHRKRHGKQHFDPERASVSEMQDTLRIQRRVDVASRVVQTQSTRELSTFTPSHTQINMIRMDTKMDAFARSSNI